MPRTKDRGIRERLAVWLLGGRENVAIRKRQRRRGGTERESGKPRRSPNAGNSIRILGSGFYLDSPQNTHGVSVRGSQDGGWLRIVVEADDSIKGWALSYNGRDIPITVERPE